jgi:hypothetical protein
MVQTGEVIKHLHQLEIYIHMLGNHCLAVAIPHLFVAADMCVIEALASNGRLLCFRYSSF